MSICINYFGFQVDDKKESRVKPCLVYRVEIIRKQLCVCARECAIVVVNVDHPYNGNVFTRIASSMDNSKIVRTPNSTRTQIKLRTQFSHFFAWKKRRECESCFTVCNLDDYYVLLMVVLSWRKLRSWRNACGITMMSCVCVKGRARVWKMSLYEGL